MVRPITIISAQWADLSFEQLCSKMSGFGYDGIEIALFGDHLDIRKAAEDPAYADEKKGILKKYNLSCYALAAHLAGKFVADLYDPRSDNLVPPECKGNPEKIQKWAIEEMMLVPRAAKNMGVKVVSGFMGSPVFKYWYSFPQTPQSMIAKAYSEVYELWTPIFDEFDRYGIKFALEVHSGEMAFDYYSTQRLFEVFDWRETLGLNFDPSHIFWQGINPQMFLQDFKERIYHVHMKDVAVNRDGRAGILGSHLEFGDVRRGWNFRSLGHGDVDFENIIRVLNQIGYKGPLSVEWEDSGMEREFGAKESLELVRNLNYPASEFAFDSGMKQ